MNDGGAAAGVIEVGVEGDFKGAARVRKRDMGVCEGVGDRLEGVEVGYVVPRGVQGEVEVSVLVCGAPIKGNPFVIATSKPKPVTI